MPEICEQSGRERARDQTRPAFPVTKGAVVVEVLATANRREVAMPEHVVGNDHDCREGDSDRRQSRPAPPRQVGSGEAVVELMAPAQRSRSRGARERGGDAGSMLRSISSQQAAFQHGLARTEVCRLSAKGTRDSRAPFCRIRNPQQPRSGALTFRRPTDTPSRKPAPAGLDTPRVRFELTTLRLTERWSGCRSGPLRSVEPSQVTPGRSGQVRRVPNGVPKADC